ncbi:MAG TPA: UvrB/UvrC motif-containing protein [Candidatus Limiplasma sp.]|nr:UvrB/UvrC motif-containing protein [Candidatus Limiplasma sp.]
MLCEECQKNPATVAITVITGNETATRHLCQECVEKMESSFAKGDMSSFLSSLLSILSKETQESAIRCDACGLTYEEFQNSGKLGCAHCYEVFSEQLKPLLLRVHGRSQHAGRVPQGHRQELQLEQCLAELKARMEKAVATENFEEAAALRDEIRALAEQQSAEVKPQ